MSLPRIFASDFEEFYSQGEVQFKNGRIRVVKRKQSAQLHVSIDTWTSAFMIYMNIIFQHNITKSQTMLNYMRNNRFAANRSCSWYNFCLHQVSNPTMIHSEFWLLYVTNQSNNQYTSQQSIYITAIA